MQVKVYLANLKLNRIYHFEKQKIIANDYLTQTKIIRHLNFRGKWFTIKLSMVESFIAETVWENENLRNFAGQRGVICKI